jgi:hypothetical protein
MIPDNLRITPDNMEIIPDYLTMSKRKVARLSQNTSEYLRMWPHYLRIISDNIYLRVTPPENT